MTHSSHSKSIHRKKGISPFGRWQGSSETGRRKGGEGGGEDPLFLLRGGWSFVNELREKKKRKGKNYMSPSVSAVIPRGGQGSVSLSGPTHHGKECCSCTLSLHFWERGSEERRNFDPHFGDRQGKNR